MSILPQDLTLLKGDLISGFFALFLLGIIGFMILALGLALISFRIHRLEFGETHFRVRGIYWLSKRRTEFAYADILRIIPGQISGIIEIVTRDGLITPLNIKQFVRPSKIIEELTRRLPPKVVVEGLPASLRRRKWIDFLSPLASAGVMITMMGSFALQDIDDLVRQQVAWQTAFRIGEGNSFQGYSIDNDGSPWLIIETNLPRKSYIFHLSPTGAEKWELPTETSMWTPDSVARDQQGYPWVMTGEGVLHWNGGEWQSLPVSLGKGVPILTASNYWMWLDEFGFGIVTNLYTFDLSTGETTPIPLPASAIEAGLKPFTKHKLLNNDLLVLFKNEEQKRIYHLRENGWQESGYSIPESVSDIDDYTLDTNGQLWALSSNVEAKAYSIGKLNPEAGIWQWYSLPMNPQYKDQWGNEYQTLEIDARGRFWLEGSLPRENWENYLVVFDLTAEGQLHEIVRYTADNSNYQSRYNMTLGPDGRIWAAKDTLVWIDSHAIDLPRPLPGWIVFALTPWVTLPCEGLLIISIFACIPVAIKNNQALQERRFKLQ